MKTILNVVTWIMYVCSVWTTFLIGIVFSKTIFKYVAENIEIEKPKVVEYIILIGVVGVMGIIVNKISNYYKNNIFLN